MTELITLLRLSIVILWKLHETCSSRECLQDRPEKEVLLSFLLLTKHFSPKQIWPRKTVRNPMSSLASATVRQPFHWQRQPLPDADANASVQKMWRAITFCARTDCQHTPDQFATGRAQHGWKLNYVWKRVSIPGSALEVIYNYGKSLLTFASQFLTHTKRKWNLISPWLSSIRSCGDQMLKNHLIWCIEGGIPVHEAWLQRPTALHPNTSILKIFATFLSSSLVLGVYPWPEVQKWQALYSPLPGLILQRQLSQSGPGKCLVSRELLPTAELLFYIFPLLIYCYCPYSCYPFSKSTQFTQFALS